MQAASVAMVLSKATYMYTYIGNHWVEIDVTSRQIIQAW